MPEHGLHGDVDEVTIYDYVVHHSRLLSHHMVATGARLPTLPTRDYPLEIMLPLSHEDTVMAVAYSPDGQHIVSGSLDTTVRLWQADTGRPLRTLRAHRDRVNAVAMSPDGRVVASGDLDGTAYLWSLDTGEILGSAQAEGGYVTDLAFDSSGRTLIIAGCQQRADDGCADGLLMAVDLVQGSTLDLSVPKTAVRKVAITRDGSQLFAAYDDGGVRVWDLRRGRLLRRTNTGEERLLGFSLHPDEHVFATSGDTATIDIWDVHEEGKRVKVLHGPDHQQNLAVFSPDGRYLATGGDELPAKTTSSRDSMSLVLETPLRVLDVAEDRVIFEEVQTSQIRDAAFSPDGDHLVVGTGFNLRVYDWANDEVVWSHEVSRWGILDVDVHEQRGLAVGGGLDGVLYVWDLRAGRLVLAIEGHEDGVRNVAISRDGRRALSSGDDEIMLWDLVSGESLQTLTGHRQAVTALAFGDDGTKARSFSVDGEVITWDLDRGVPVGRATTAAACELDICYIEGELTKDGRKLVSSNRETDITVWDSGTGRVLAKLGGRGNVMSLSRDGRLVLLGQLGHSELWDITTAELLHRWEHPGFWARAADFIQGAGPERDDIDTRVVIAGFDWPADNHSELRAWDVRSGGYLGVLDERDGVLTSLAISPAGSWALTGYEDGAMELSNIERQASLTMLGQGPDWVVFTPDGLFDSSPRGVDLVTAVQGRTGFSIDQLAFVRNRPDLILERLGLSSPELIQRFESLHRRRLRAAGLVESSDLGAPSLPTARMISVTRKGAHQAVVEAEVRDADALKSYQVYVGGVPIFAGLGRPVSGSRARIREVIELRGGDEVVEVSAFDSRGRESLRAQAEVTSPARPGSLYVVGIGVSDYADDELDLMYASKDAESVAKTLERTKGFERVHVETVLDADVSGPWLERVQRFLVGARTQDTVVVFLAGHGMYDDDGIYRYFIHRTDLDRLSDTATDFAAIESLLEGIAPRHKVLLLDTCESGERDETETSTILSVASERGLTSRLPRGMRRVSGVSSSSVPPDHDRLIHRVLARRTGAIVFSSSTGRELSYESKALAHGLFTAALLEALTSDVADANGDARVDTEELRRYLSEAVSETSHGLQHPTVDRDNMHQRISFPLIQP